MVLKVCVGLLPSLLFLCRCDVQAAEVSAQIGKNHELVKSAFREVIARANQSTVRVFCDGAEPDVALGTVVSSQGHILTKASQLSNKVVCQFPNGRRFGAKVLAVLPDYDLALLRVRAGRLTPIQFAPQVKLPVGSFLATPGRGRKPLAIGIVSRAAFASPPDTRLLGVVVEPTPTGPRVTRVRPRSVAQDAGIRAGDLVHQMDGRRITTCSDFLSVMRLPGMNGKHVFHIRRGSARTTASVILRWPTVYAALSDPDSAVVARRRDGGRQSDAVLSAALPHDTILRANDCGGPVVDLDGKVVGINIARPTRASSYALPAKSILVLLDRLVPKNGVRKK